jgi:hypothetical protein
LGSHHMPRHYNFEIILHPRDRSLPRGIADQMVCTRDGRKLRRRILLE